MSSHYRILDVTIISAKDLKNVNLISALHVYAVATISGDPSTRQRTHADLEGRRNPTWNTTFRFLVPDSPDASRLTLDVLLRAERALGDRNVGEVHVPIADLVAGAKERKFVGYQVTRPSGKGKGVLNLSYSFEAAAPTAASYPPREKVVEEQVMKHVGYQYPYPQPVSYPPPPAGYPAGSKYQVPAACPAYYQTPAGCPACYYQASAGCPACNQPVSAGYPAYNQAPAGYPAYFQPAPAGYPAYFQPAPAGYGCGFR